MSAAWGGLARGHRKAVVYHGPANIRVEEATKPKLVAPTDVIGGRPGASAPYSIAWRFGWHRRIRAEPTSACVRCWDDNAVYLAYAADRGHTFIDRAVLVGSRVSASGEDRNAAALARWPTLPAHQIWSCCLQLLLVLEAGSGEPSIISTSMIQCLTCEDAPAIGLEPITCRLTAGCSAN